MRSVLQLLADTSGQNIVVSDSVTGNLTLRLQNVPWDQALDIVLRTKGLDKRRQDNVIIIGPTAELATREKAELAARKTEGAGAAMAPPTAGKPKPGSAPPAETAEQLRARVRASLLRRSA